MNLSMVKRLRLGFVLWTILGVFVVAAAISTASSGSSVSRVLSRPVSGEESAPVNTVAPSAAVNEAERLLTGTQGSWSGSSITYAYLWEVSSDGATWSSSATTLADSVYCAAADAGFVRLRVTATNSSGSTDAYSPPVQTGMLPGCA
jgi:hypothetical protein